jgi:hypothetical protein
MDATDKQQYTTHLVMNSPRYGQTAEMWIVRLPVSCGLQKQERVRGLTPLEIQKMAVTIDLSVLQHGALARWQ